MNHRKEHLTTISGWIIMTVLCHISHCKDHRPQDNFTAETIHFIPLWAAVVRSESSRGSNVTKKTLWTPELNLTWTNQKSSPSCSVVTSSQLDKETSLSIKQRDVWGIIELVYALMELPPRVYAYMCKGWLWGPCKAGSPTKNLPIRSMRFASKVQT